MAEGGRVSPGLVRSRSPSLEEHLSKFPQRHLLDRPCVESHLVQVKNCFSDWQSELSTYLELTPVECQDIESNWPRDSARQRLEMFRKWQEKYKEKATYRWLISAFHEAQRADVIDSLRQIVVSSSTTHQPNTQYTTHQHPERLIQYSAYLKKRKSGVHTAAVSKKWLPAPTQKIFNLAIIEKDIVYGKIDNELVNKTIQGNVDDILLKKSSIELEKLFNDIEERKVILINGAPGSGKSTLTVHIFQGWRRGELFKEFSIVILVQLRDPAVQSAQSIADLIPSRDKKMSQQVASAISEVDGRGILWILDGWDELPSRLRETSLLREMITPSLHSPITQSSVIVTSRPVASGELSELVSSQIEVLGFTRKEQRQYFTECLKEFEDTKAVDTLLERLSENPAIEGSCYLPLNASIVAHLYRCDHSFPLTLTVHGIFSSLVKHSLSHYLCQRLGKTRAEARLTSLDSESLPQELLAPFNQLCELAFTGVSKDKVTFSQSDLKSVEDSAVICEVGLLQATHSILSDGETVYYNFLHLSIQEMLSAYYISNLSPSEQMSTFDSLFSDSRFSAVFQFYAAITKLRTEGIRELVSKIIKKQKSTTLLVSLLQCMYEAQDPSLCQFVAKQLGSELDLGRTSLTPVDSLAIGYFLSSVSLTTSNTKEFRADLGNCSLGDAGTKRLMQSICRSLNRCPQSTVNTHLFLDLHSNRIQKEGASHIAELLYSTSMVSKLLLYGNPISDSGLQTIFNTLKQNKTLKLLSVANCGMTDTGVASLADALYSNNTLERIYINSNKAITENGLTCLVEAVSRHSGMVRLFIPKHLDEVIMKKTINEARAKNGLGNMDVW